MGAGGRGGEGAPRSAGLIIQHVRRGGRRPQGTRNEAPRPTSTMLTTEGRREGPNGGPAVQSGKAESFTRETQRAT